MRGIGINFFEGLGLDFGVGLQTVTLILGLLFMQLFTALIRGDEPRTPNLNTPMMVVYIVHHESELSPLPFCRCANGILLMDDQRSTNHFPDLHSSVLYAKFCPTLFVRFDNTEFTILLKNHLQFHDDLK